MIGQLGHTERKDLWWLEPVANGLYFAICIGYLTWAAFQSSHYEWGPYLSPAYSPLFKPSWWPFSPAFLILWAPAGFRMTCYYYRKMYYRSYFLSPAACAVGKPWSSYSGETAFPFIAQNVHRFFFYLAALFILILTYDAIRSFNFEGQFGIGVGSLVLCLNTLCLACYTFSCHSCRHLLGGRMDCFSKTCASRYQASAWQVISLFNERHSLWAWISLTTVSFSDLYVRMVSMGIWRDIRLM